MQKLSALLGMLYSRFVTDLPRRSIQVSAFAVVVIGVLTLASGNPWGLWIFSSGAYVVAHPFDSHRVADMLTEVIRRKWGGPPP